MPHALTAFPQQLLNPLNLQPATGVEGLQRGRRAPLNHSLFHHDPRGCATEMFNMNTDNWEENCALCLQLFMKPHPFIRFKSDYYGVMSVMFRSHEEMIIWIL